MTGATSKEQLRKRFLEARRSRSFEEVFALSALVQRRFLDSGFYRAASRMALYSSFGNEVLTDDIFREAVRQGKEVFYPMVVRGSGCRLAFFRVEDLEDLAPGSYDILEPPEGGREAEPSIFDLVVAPGVAFDRTGARLGYGKGYYDRALKGAGCPVVALAFGFQVLDSGIPSEAHDVRMDALVTEAGVMDIAGDR